jgi:hypothetical protein
VGSNRERNLYSCGELCVDAICCHSLPLWVFYTALVVPNHRCGQKNRARLPGCAIAPAGSIVPGFALNLQEDNESIGSWRSEAQAVD